MKRGTVGLYHRSKQRANKKRGDRKISPLLRGGKKGRLTYSRGLIRSISLSRSLGESKLNDGIRSLSSITKASLNRSCGFLPTCTFGGYNMETTSPLLFASSISLLS